MILRSLTKHVKDQNGFAGALDFFIHAGTVEAMHHVVASGKRAVDFPESDRSCEADCWRVLIDFFVASQVFRPAVGTTVGVTAILP
jgi:hypothetical protein